MLSFPNDSLDHIVSSAASRGGSPFLECRPLPEFDVEDWSAVAAAFANAASCEFAQSWRGSLQREFQPGTVRVGWREQALWVLAEMRDLDIYNNATQLNDITYALGDVFEMFLQCGRQKHYFELHITPENQRLQIRFESEPRKLKDKDLPVIEQRDLFFSRTGVWPDEQRWQVLAGVPAAVVEGEDCFSPGNSWRFSFGRYDYTRGCKQPVLSSTSALTAPDFHCRAEWGTLLFAE
jgi:hypothetical protein